MKKRVYVLLFSMTLCVTACSNGKEVATDSSLDQIYENLEIEESIIDLATDTTETITETDNNEEEIIETQPSEDSTGSEKDIEETIGTDTSVREAVKETEDKTAATKETKAESKKKETETDNQVEVVEKETEVKSEQATESSSVVTPSNNGNSNGNPLQKCLTDGHNWQYLRTDSDNSCFGVNSIIEKCTYCSSERIAERTTNGHIGEERREVTFEPTCGNEGLIRVICTACECEIYSEFIPTNENHSWVILDEEGQAFYGGTEVCEICCKVR